MVKRNRNLFRNAFRKKNAKGAMAIAKKALKKVNKVVRSVETKQLIITASGTVGLGGTILSLHTIAQGLTVADRVGNMITAKKLDIRWSLETDIAANTNMQLIRYIVFRDTQQNPDGTPTVSLILQTANPLSTYFRPFLKRFQILRDRLFCVNNGGKNCMSGHWKFKMDSDIRYNGPLITDIQKNGLFCLVISNQSGLLPTFDSHNTLDYTDA